MSKRSDHAVFLNDITFSENANESDRRSFQTYLLTVALNNLLL